MIKKNITLLLLAFSLASCSSTKKTNDVAAAQPKKESQTETAAVFSVPAAEVATSENGPQVVYFSTNSAALDKDATAILEKKVLPEAQNVKTKKVVIEAHCDERGSKAYNKKLSVKRANAVKEYLVKNGVKEVKIKTVGYGKSKPVALGHDEASWAKNRRAVTISVKK